MHESGRTERTKPFRAAALTIALAGSWFIALGLEGRLPAVLEPGEAVLFGGMTAALAALVRARDPHVGALWTIPFSALIAGLCLVGTEVLDRCDRQAVAALVVASVPLVALFRLAEAAALDPVD